MSDALFDVYQNVESAKELWDQLEAKYMAEDTFSKKFLVNDFNNYIMVDSSIIDKLPPSWKDFKHMLKHNKDELSLVQLGSHFRIEETLRMEESGKGKGKDIAGSSSVNMVEDDKNKKNNKNSKGNKRKFHEKKNDSNKKSKMACWKCGKPGHFKKDCRVKKNNGVSTSGSGQGSKDPSPQQGLISDHVIIPVKYYVSHIYEICYVQDDEIAWWIDSGATCHACKDRCWFDTFHPVEDGSVLHMGDESTKPILGRGNVVIEFSSGKTITLFNVVYVPGLRKNLMSGPVLNKCGYRQVYESDKYILSRHGVFIGFGYYNNGMFMLNLNKVPSSINSVYMAYSHVVDSKLWHARLGHVHYQRLHDMSKDNLIPSFDKNMEKCNTCMLTKITRQPFKDIKRNSVLLELIHSDLCDFHATPSIGNKKYVVTYIDDASRFCYVYLLHAKDEALDKFKIYKTEVELQQNRIIHQTTAPYTPQQNGVSERKNRALKEMVNSMLFYSGLSEGFWREAMLTYVEHSKAYRFYVIEPKDFVSVNSIIESRDAIFDKNIFSSIPKPNDIVSSSNGTQGGDLPGETSTEIPEPRRSNRARKEAIDDEIGSIMENNTWVLSDLPPGCKPLGCKWIFKKKMKVDGTIDKFKARLVIQGFRQKEGIDYFDTYAIVARISTIRLLIVLAATHNLVIHQMDVKTSFLNGDLEEEIYMKQPEGFVMPGNEHKVCKLIKSLYGLKQAPKQWHHKFDEVVLSNGFVLNQSDKCVYCKFDESGKGVIICLYVDDMLIFGDQTQVDKTKEFLSSNFSMKDMGEADVILGIRIKRENKGLTITQSHYIEKIIKKFNCEGCGPVSTPMGAGYSDASWITNSEDHTSTTGWVFLLGGSAISWASKKQTCITDSTMESEFVALAAAGKEVEWLRNLIYEIPLWPKLISPISMHCDSDATLAMAYSQIYNGKSRHLGVRHSMVRELITNGVIYVDFVRSQQNLADHLTKGLAKDLVHKSAIGMGLKCKTKRTTYVSMECRRFKKLGLGFLYAHEGYGHKAL
ncbi:zinc finger, CCHC-type containing protein [Tanacetum coccineum]